MKRWLISRKKQAVKEQETNKTGSIVKKENKIVSVFWQDTFVGRISLLPDELAVFEYDAEFLKTGTSISPFYLPLNPGVFTAKKEPFQGLFGIFSDSLPDGWGTLLTNRMLREKGYDLAEINVLDRLCLVGKNGIGALSYHPEWNMAKQHSISDYNTIAQEVENVLLHDSSENLSELFALGGSSGGARPKIFTDFKNEPWIIKFRSTMDPKNIGEMEYDYSLSAKQCGIEMSETRLFEKKYFGTRRFDINGGLKYHVHSVAGLLYASHRIPSLDYLEIMKATFVLTKDINELYKLFRLMVFNVLTENKDDHSKNFSFILRKDKWQLAPAYDLVKSQGFNNQHTTTVMGSGNPTKNEMFALASKVNLKKSEVGEIYDEVYYGSEELRKIYCSRK